MSWSSGSSSSDDEEPPKTLTAAANEAEEAKNAEIVTTNNSEQTEHPTAAKITATGDAEADGQQHDVEESSQNRLPSNAKKHKKKRSHLDDDEEPIVHGENAFLGSRLDPLHPENLNAEILLSNVIERKRIEAHRTSSSLKKGAEAPSLDDPKQDTVDKSRLVKGCPPEVRSQYRELLDAGLVSRADYLGAIQKYIENLPEDLKPDTEESGSDVEKSLSESSEVSLGLHDDFPSSSDEGDLLDDELAESGDDGIPSEVPEGFSHKPLTHGDATNYPIEGDSCTIHVEGKIIPPSETEGEDVEPVVFESTYKRSEPITVQIGRGDVIRGIEFALQYMSTGQKSAVIVPPEWAYGAVGYPPIISPHQTVHFTVELLRFSNDADARASSGKEPNPVPIGMEQFTKGEFDMNDVTMKAESSYWQVINDHLPS